MRTPSLLLCPEEYLSEGLHELRDPGHQAGYIGLPGDCPESLAIGNIEQPNRHAHAE